jgi:hypothetical protein
MMSMIRLNVDGIITGYQIKLKTLLDTMNFPYYNWLFQLQYKAVGGLYQKYVIRLLVQNAFP